METDQLRVTRQISQLQADSEESLNSTEAVYNSPPFYKDGPHPLISDSLFSLIIFIYVSVTFLYIFYAFCWRTEIHKPMPDGRNLPMITEMLEAVEQSPKENEKKEEV